MSKIAIDEAGWLICNGRKVAYNGRISEIDRVSAGRWEGEAGGEPFTIIGGRASGGASNEWFVTWSPGYGDQNVPVKSAVAALNMIERC